MKLLAFTTAALAASLPAYAAPGDGREYYGHMWNGGYGHSFFGGLFMLLFWGALIVITILAVKWFIDRDNGASPGGRRSSSAEQILQDRLAKGEIEPEEYRERMKTLREDA
ncbi:hypothetical protein [uncultured Roseovarius sp.]|uniref:SHOCT domain-containing protein n=1 Tax=uncultured Roseovarius sp. TaxID=293344 RepID=UPI00262AAD73|nr:hypothetical protein [uncultured Roseovarius sp.]